MKRIALAIALVLAVLGLAGTARAQYYYSVPVFNSRGLPSPGTNVAICSALATTAASVSSVTGLATFTMASNPTTAGFTAGSTIVVANFTGADTYFNGNYTVASAGSTAIVVALAHSTASATSNGSIVQKGTASTACAPLATIYTDETLTATSPNPFFTDSFGNLNFWSAAGSFFYGYLYGATINPFLFPITIPAPGAAPGPVNPGYFLGNCTASPAIPVYCSLNPPTAPGLFLGNCTGSTATPTYCAPGVDTELVMNIAGAMSGSPDLLYVASSGQLTVDATGSGGAPAIFLGASASGDYFEEASGLTIGAKANNDVYIGNRGGQHDYQFGGGGLLPAGAVTFGGGGATGSLLLNEGGLSAGMIEGPSISGAKFSFSELPACTSDIEGSHMIVVDSTTNTWGATITGSGADHVNAYCDGTNWTVAAK